MARKTSKTDDTTLSSGQVSLVNRYVSRIARDNGLAATSFNIAGQPKTVAGAVALLATVTVLDEGDSLDDLNTLLSSSEGATKREVLAVIAPKKTAKRTTKKATPKARKATIKQQPKAEAGAKRLPVKDLDDAAARLAKAPEGLRQWWAKAHSDQIKAIGLKADGSVVKGGKIAKAMANV